MWKWIRIWECAVHMACVTGLHFAGRMLAMSPATAGCLSQRQPHHYLWIGKKPSRGCSQPGRGWERVLSLPRFGATRRKPFPHRPSARVSPAWVQVVHSVSQGNSTAISHHLEHSLILLFCQFPQLPGLWYTALVLTVTGE